MFILFPDVSTMPMRTIFPINMIRFSRTFKVRLYFHDNKVTIKPKLIDIIFVTYSILNPSIGLKACLKMNINNDKSTTFI